MKLIVSGGGSGGHVYPALAAVQSLTRHCAKANIPFELLWIGSLGGMEQRLIERASLKIELIPAGGLRGKNPVALAGGLWSLSRGYRQSRKIIHCFQPDVLFITGGYVSVPVTLAAWQAGIPVVIYLPDIEPGLAIKFLARFAAKVAISTDETAKFFKPGLAVVTGYPVRAELLSTSASEAGKITARRQLSLSHDWPVLLVFGGSQGARSINRAVAEQIEAYLQVCQVIHISGDLGAAWVQARWAELPPELQERYYVSAYLHEEMISALLAADLVISRAGASVLGEYPAIGLPAILVPYPYAGTHQALNAAYLVRHQAAVMINDADLSRDLKETATGLITDKKKLQAMSQACKNLAKPDAAERLAREVLEVGLHGRN